MNINDAYPSKRIRATDLKGQTHVVTIDRYAFEDMGGGDGMKPVLYFRNREKGLVLNKTNGVAIGVIHGEDMDAWAGKPIELYPDTVPFQGQIVPCVRVRCVAEAYVATVQQSPMGVPLTPAPLMAPPQAAGTGGPVPQGPGDQAAAQAQQAQARPTAQDQQAAIQKMPTDPADLHDDVMLDDIPF